MSLAKKSLLFVGKKLLLLTISILIAVVTTAILLAMERLFKVRGKF